MGQWVSDPVFLVCGPCVATIAHDGQSNFAVWLHGDEEDLLVNEIGPYSGDRFIPVTTSPSTFEIDADGSWSIVIEQVPGGDAGPGFSGRGDAVSGYFNAPAPGAFEVAHDGQSNFAVWLHCDGGFPDLVQNEIGPVTGSTYVDPFGDRCIWEVEADGNWSLTPR